VIGPECRIKTMRHGCGLTLIRFNVKGCCKIDMNKIRATKAGKVRALQDTPSLICGRHR
jgi:hypothetical protein